MIKFLFLTTISFFSLLNIYATTNIDILCHYNFAPWVISEVKKEGIFYDFVNELNKGSNKNFKFHPVVVPRKRIDLELTNKKDKIIAFVDPIFFNDSEKTKYNWSYIFLSDESYIISHVDTPINYTGSESLIGKKFSATLGHFYKDLDPLISKGLIKRYDVVSYLDTIKKVIHKRDVDFAIIDRSLLYYLNSNSLDLTISKIYKSPKARLKFNRLFLVHSDDKSLLNHVNATITYIRNDLEWNKKIIASENESKKISSAFSTF